jgi:hypothetical protein
MARPSTYSSELVETICSLIAEGKSVAEVCRSDGMPALRTFLRWADEREDVASEYRRALEARSEWQFAEHDRIRQTAVDKESAAAARVQLAALEWAMSKMAPKKYGDKLDVTVGPVVGLAGELEAARLRAAELAPAYEDQAGTYTPLMLPAPD